MTLSISNIAWERSDDEAVAALLLRTGVNMIDVAPSKYFGDFSTATEQSINAVRTWWHDRGIRIIGMQSLLYGTQGLNVFGDRDVQARLLAHLRHVFRIAEHLGADRLVFGSPRNRDRGELDITQANEVAASFFTLAGDAAEQHGLTLCLEPNPSRYGSNFMTDTISTAMVVEMVAHPRIRMQWDTGATFVNREPIEQLLARYSPLIGHIHLSEPDLLPVGSVHSDHERMASALKKHSAGYPFTLEMLPPADGLQGIEASLQQAIRHYSPISAGTY